MKKLLWIGDACCDSGFARATHYTLDTLRHRFDVAVLGLNYLGDPHAYPYQIYPAWPGKDMFGVGRLEDVVPKVRPDVIVIQNDPWNIPYYIEVLEHVPQIPVVGILAVDGKNCRGGKVNGTTAKERGLNALSLAVFWTQFGLDEARAGGYEGPAAVVPLGVDRTIYKPRDQAFARKEVGLPLPDDAFLVGNVNRNQPRKRLDLTLMYFGEWVSKFHRDDAYLFLHVAPTGEMAYEVNQLTQYLGLHGRVILSEPTAYKGLSELQLSHLYSCFDVGISTTQGEGWGLPALEMMACGVPQLLPDWSAYGEWARDAARLVPCTTVACTFNSINVIGGLADRELFVQALEDLYSWPQVRQEMSSAGIALANDPRYAWPNIANALGDAIEQTLWPVTADETVAV